MPRPIDHCYWTQTARPQRFETLAGDREVDVAVIGGGIVGTIAARLLKDRGLTVAILEAGRIGHGVTGRSTAKVTAQHALFLQRIEKDHGEAAARTYAEANRAGVALVAELVGRQGLACDWEPADSVVYAATEDGARSLEREHAAAARAGLPMELTADAGLPFTVTAALRLAGQFQFHPADFVAGLADATSFKLDEGLSWAMGGETGRTRTESEIHMWKVARGAAGRMPPQGFPRDNRF